MKLLFVIVLIVVAVLAYYMVRRAVAAVRASKAAKTPWKVIEDESNGATSVLLVRPGEEPLQIGSAVPLSLPHWEYAEQIEERWVDAEARAEEKNRRFQRSLKA